MRRKVALIGPSTLMVSLPSKWVSRLSIKKGDELEILEQGNNLLVQGKGTEKKPIEVKISNSELTTRFLNKLYVLGYDEIKLDFVDSIDINRLYEELSWLIGFEIIEQSENSCIIKNVAQTMDKELPNIIRRIFLMLRSMSLDSLDAIKKSQPKRLRDISQIETTNNKLTLLCERILNRYLFSNEIYSKTIKLITELEKIADYYKCIVEFLYKNQDKLSLSKETRLLYEDVGSHLNDIYLLYYSFSQENLISVRNKKRELKARAQMLLGSTKDYVVTSYLLFIIHILSELENICIN